VIGSTHDICACEIKPRRIFMRRGEARQNYQVLFQGSIGKRWCNLFSAHSVIARGRL
jgi:hypothetical protein